jgi:hypothetical protein
MPLTPLRPLFPRLVGGCVLIAAMMGYCRQGSAEFFQFSTTTTIGAVAPVPMSIAGNGTNFVQILTAANTPISFTGLASIGPENLVSGDGGTDIVFGLIDVQVVNATALQNILIPFTFDMTITDYPTDLVGIPDGVGVFSISGVISGTIGAGRKVNMNNIVVNPVAPILIGNDLYTLTFNTLVPPGPFFPGAIGAHVEVVPEPATCVLLGLGVVAIAIPAVRRRRGRRVSSGS